MKNFIKTKVPFIIVCLAFILFVGLFFVISGDKLDTFNTSLWLGFAFICLAFILIGVFTFTFKLKSKSTMTTIWPMFYVLGGYLLITLIANIIFMAINSPERGATIASSVINAIIIIVAIALFLLAYKSFSRVSDNTEKREKRVAALREMYVRVNGLSSLTTDSDIRTIIGKLAERVRYSTSAGTPASAPYEEQFAAQIETINTLLLTKADKQEVLEALKIAVNLLTTRNQMLLARKVN